MLYTIKGKYFNEGENVYYDAKMNILTGSIKYTPCRKAEVKMTHGEQNGNEGWKFLTKAEWEEREGIKPPKNWQIV
tara:strand:- start:13 stop:240 length:228 start_codon:yes stop_codon:yes gene_type:complete